MITNSFWIVTENNECSKNKGIFSPHSLPCPPLIIEYVWWKTIGWKTVTMVSLFFSDSLNQIGCSFLGWLLLLSTIQKPVIMMNFKEKKWERSVKEVIFQSSILTSTIFSICGQGVWTSCVLDGKCMALILWKDYDWCVSKKVCQEPTVPFC